MVRLRAEAFLLWLPACSAGPAATELDAAARETAVVQDLPAGTLVGLLPVQGELPPEAKANALDGVWREAIRQSARLDVAAGPVAVDDRRVPALQLTVDHGGRTLAATLHEHDRVLHVAAVSYRDRPITSAIDDLALRARLSLGEAVTQAPVPVAAAYSANLEAVALCEDALVRAQEGEYAAAQRFLAAARRLDGGSPMVLDAMASLGSMLGQTDDALQQAGEALRMKQRLSPTTMHRLARTLLLARASTAAARAAEYDRELLTLATVAHAERPHDPEPLLTRGVALNFLGRFDEAAAVLRPLAERLPRNPSVHYHLGWAELALGRAEPALASLLRVAPVLPAGTTVVPRALALYAGGEHERLRAFLADLAADPTLRASPALHDVRRMQSAHALLCNRPDDATELLLADLAWLMEQPTRLRDRAGELVDAGEVLVRLGRGDALRPLLKSLPQLNLGPAVADAGAYLEGLVDAAAQAGRVPIVEEGLRQRGATVWSWSLCAFGHRQLGELGDENVALAEAARQSSSPLLKAALVRNLRAIGRVREADALRDALRRELVAIDLRRRLQHPLLGPELALAWLVE